LSIWINNSSVITNAISNWLEIIKYKKISIHDSVEHLTRQSFSTELSMDILLEKLNELIHDISLFPSFSSSYFCQNNQHPLLLFSNKSNHHSHKSGHSKPSTSIYISINSVSIPLGLISCEVSLHRLSRPIRFFVTH
jgi:hypothetical protein